MAMLEFCKVWFSDLFFFLIYINHLTENLPSNPRLFADNISLFKLINDPNTTAKQLCENLDKIKEWTFQWKMSFNPDPSKQAQEFIFTRKVKKVLHLLIFFNKKPVQQFSSQRHLSHILDTPFAFDERIRSITSKVNKSMGLLQKLVNCLPRSFLITIYKSFVRPHLDYGDVIFDNAYNNSFQQEDLNLFNTRIHWQYQVLLKVLLLKGFIKS